MYKKIISIILAITIAISMPISALASEVHSTTISPLTANQTAKLVAALSDFEIQKNYIGLSNVNFCNLSIGNPVQTYIYTNGAFVEDRIMYPILDNNTLVLWALEVNGSFQLTTGLVNEVNNCLVNSEPFAIVYDSDKSYLFQNGTFSLLTVFPYKDTSRSVLDPVNTPSSISLTTTHFSQSTPINYMPTRAGTPYKLDVDFVSQDLSHLGLPTSAICWAAVAACIVNYCNGTSLTAEKVAKKYYPPANFNEGLLMEEFPDVLSLYNIDYVYKSRVPSDGKILENLQADYPIASGWSTPGVNGHVCALYGINVVSGYIYLMDPSLGFTSAVSGSNGYTFVNTSGSRTYTFTDAACYSW